MPKSVTPNTVIICTGGFDPIHSGHVRYLTEAKSIANVLIVGVNSDAWLTRKKGKNFMPYSERVSVVGALGVVDQVLAFDDSDNSANDCIRQVITMYPNDNIIFANGGDRVVGNIQEFEFCVNANVAIITNIGGAKVTSSSLLLQQWNNELLAIQTANSDTSIIL